MEVGIISEGVGDFAVLRNIVRGALGIEKEEVLSLRPDLQSDETELHAKPPSAFSNWEIVLDECRSGALIKLHLDNSLDAERFVVVHIDTAECHLPNYGVTRPDKTLVNYVQLCRDAVAQKLRALLSPTLSSCVALAVAVEETEAWVIPLYDDKKPSSTNDTGQLPNPKNVLESLLNKPNRFNERDRRALHMNNNTLQRDHNRSESLRKRTTLEQVAARNVSLQLFLDELRAVALQCKSSHPDTPSE